MALFGELNKLKRAGTGTVWRFGKATLVASTEALRMAVAAL
jgi:hypothetical protein